MPAYVAFLRAINLGPRRRIAMTDLATCLEAVGFSDVATYLATGNVRVRSRHRSAEAVEKAVEDALGDRFGFDVPTIALTRPELAEVVEEMQSTPAAARTYVTLLKGPTSPDLVAALGERAAAGESLRAGRRAVHWWADHDMRGGALDNATIERHLGVATTRTTKVVRTVWERWGADE